MSLKNGRWGGDRQGYAVEAGDTLLLLSKVAAGSCCSSSPTPGGERKRYWDLVRKHEKGQPCQLNLEDKSKI